MSLPDDTFSPRSARRLVVTTAATLAHHALGVFATGLGILLFVVGPDRVQLLYSTMMDPTFAAYTEADLWSGVLVAALSWGLLYLSFRILRAGFDRHRETTVVRLSRGTVLTETLVVLPVALLLYLGLAQLALNNVAAILANLATFHAARTMWVWMPEVNSGRRYVTEDMAVERARIQAALVLAPVAAADYAMDLAILTPASQATLDGMFAAQLPFIAEDMGQYAGPELQLLLSLEDPGGLVRRAVRGNQSLTTGLDATTFRLRTIRKFTFAFAATNVAPVVNNGQVGVDFTYLHFNSVPLVGRPFGELATVGGREGYYAAFERRFLLPEQLDSNPAMP